MPSQSILIIAAGSLQIPIIAAAKNRGLRVVAIDGDAAAPGLGMADSTHVIRLDDYDGSREIAERERVIAVTSLCTDFAVRATAYVAERLGLPGPGLEAAWNATDKR